MTPPFATSPVWARGLAWRTVRINGRRRARWDCPQRGCTVHAIVKDWRDLDAMVAEHAPEHAALTEEPT